MRKGIIFNFIIILSVITLAACGIKQDNSEEQVTYNAPTTEQTTEMITHDEETTTEIVQNDSNDTEKETDDPASDSESPISVKWADEVAGDSTDYISYEPDNSDEYTRHVLFSTNKEVKNFRIVEVFIKGSDDEGNLEILYEERYKLDLFTPEKPLCAGMNFPGDIPNNGFVYTDENGKDRVFIVSESGKDGSLFVSEYE